MSKFRYTIRLKEHVPGKTFNQRVLEDGILYEREVDFPTMNEDECETGMALKSRFEYADEFLQKYIEVRHEKID